MINHIFVQVLFSLIFWMSGLLTFFYFIEHETWYMSLCFLLGEICLFLVCIGLLNIFEFLDSSSKARNDVQRDYFNKKYIRMVKFKGQIAPLLLISALFLLLSFLLS